MKKNSIIQEKSKDKLRSAVQKRIKTTMIGAISSIEKIFGELWGHEHDQKTPEEQEIYKLFEELRTKILDDGNNQVRNFDNDLQAYDVEWTGYHLEMPITKRGN